MPPRHLNNDNRRYMNTKHVYMDTKNGHTYKNGVTFYKPFFLGVSMLVFWGVYTVYYLKKKLRVSFREL